MAMTSRAGRLAGAIVAAAAVCAAPVASADPKIQPGEERALSLGLLGPDIPDILKQAAADPYAPPGEPACTTVPQEIAKLDALLGPDINQAKPKMFEPAKLIGHAVRSAIPYRGYIRFLTGADRKEKRLSQAAMAGWARRGFLKGLAAKLDCPGQTQLAQSAGPPASQAPVAAPPSSATPVAAGLPALIPAANEPGGGAARLQPADSVTLGASQRPGALDGR